MADVFELADVAGEAKILHDVHRGRGQRFHVAAERLRAFAEEMLHQQRYIIAPLTQRRQAQTNHVQTVQQVFAKHALFHTFVEILVRCGDDAHVRFHRRLSADAVILAVLQHAQQTHLQIRRHVADFIEEQRAAFGLLKAALSRRLRASERAAFVTEQFRFEQIFRDRRRVDGDERFAFAQAVFVQRARHEFFASTGFAGDEHGHMRLRQAANGAEHILHRCRFAEHFALA